jgi:hypothetical protein
MKHSLALLIGRLKGEVEAISEQGALRREADVLSEPAAHF